MTLFRCSCSDVNIRKEYVKLVEDVRDAGGEVKIFSSMHISGQRKCFSLKKKLYLSKRDILMRRC